MTYEISFDPNPAGGALGARTGPNYPLTNQVAVTDAATLVADRRIGHGPVTLQNIDPDNDVFIGNESVTATTGFRLQPSEGITISSEDKVYAICGSGLTATVGFLKDAP